MTETAASNRVAPAGRQRTDLQSGASPQGSALEVLRIFLRLGLTSFGGPVAHLGYFRAELVERRRWLDESHYADIVALCQFLPGPASSQTGITLGILRAGLPGALAAWIGFSGPSALAMILFGYGVGQLGDIADVPWLHGLKIVAVAVVANAVWGMARNLCPDRQREDRGADCDRGALAVRGETLCHTPNRLRDDRDRDDLQPVQPCRVAKIAKPGHPVSEQDQRQRRGHRKPDPGS